MLLYINGRLEGSAKSRGFITADPKDVMQIGADLGSPVVAEKAAGFAGLIESVHLFSGEREAKDITADAGKAMSGGKP